MHKDLQKVSACRTKQIVLAAEINISKWKEIISLALYMYLHTYIYNTFTYDQANKAIYCGVAITNTEGCQKKLYKHRYIHMWKIVETVFGNVVGEIRSCCRLS